MRRSSIMHGEAKSLFLQVAYVFKPGTRCVDGRCTKPQCQDHDDCLQFQVCVQGNCEEETCQSWKDCDDGLVCRNEQCQTCIEHNECPFGHQCEDGKCLKEAETCKNSRQCPDDSCCIRGACLQACVRGRKCPDENQECFQKFCFDKCIRDEDCDVGSDCILNGICSPSAIKKNVFDNTCPALSGGGSTDFDDGW